MKRFIAVIAAGGLIALTGCRASLPGAFETKTVNAIKHHITVGGRKDANPFTGTPSNIAAGKEAFGHYCAACHGLDGQNSGVPFADHMSPPVPPLNSPSVQAYTDGQLKWVIDYGLKPSGMPGSKGILSDDEIWSTVLYIRHLPPAGSIGEPEMYSH